MPASALTFVPDGDQATAKADLYIGSIDDKGRMSEISHQQTSFRIPADKASSDQTLALQRDAADEEGKLPRRGQCPGFGLGQDGHGEGERESRMRRKTKSRKP
jgi:hypothetical protein